ncbi:MAG: glycosyltransferase [Pseudomonadales bacterium]|nr:glycosyltransferase [Pseudomonadales bacterium]
MSDIIYFGNDWNAENKTSSHHISERLSRTNRLIYVECPGLRAPKGTGRDFKKIFSKLLKCVMGPRKINDSLYVYTLFQLPFHRYPLVRLLNSWLVIASISLLKFWLGIKQPTLWFVVPHLSMVPKKVKAKACVYYCIDDYAGIPDVDATAVERMDDDMTKKCDIVFIASDTLYDRKKTQNTNLHVSPHGVDFDHFNQALKGNLTTPSDISTVAKPIIGCFGLIDDRIDLELISKLAKAHPEWSFIMIGRLDVDSNPCENLKNVHFLGRRPYSDLPRYAASFDVSIMPYKPKHRMNINCNPLKLREYLSTGTPIVSARIPQAEQYADVIAIADDTASYEQAILSAIENDTSTAQTARLNRVKDSTWDARVQTVVETVNKNTTTTINNI